MIRSAWAVFQKDLLLELRSKVAVNTVLLFGVVSLVVVSFSVGAEELTPTVQASLLWVVLLFSAITSLSLLFVREEDSGTALVLRVVAPAQAVFMGKFWLNLLLFFIQFLVLVPLYHIFLKPSVSSIPLYLLILFLGLGCITIACTFAAALVARAASRGALFGVMSLPIMIVPLWSLAGGSTKLFNRELPAAELFSSLAPYLQVLTAYLVVMVTLSFLLFPHLWDD